MDLGEITVLAPACFLSEHWSPSGHREVEQCLFPEQVLPLLWETKRLPLRHES